MKIAITSDIHNNETNLKKVLRYLEDEKIEMIICCGDLASLEIMDFLNDNFSGTIHYTFGNADYDDLRDLESQKKYKNTFIYKDFGETTISSSPARKEEKKIAFVHFPNVAKKLASTGKYDFVFYGHTHKPWEEKIDNCKMLNPGTLAGEIYPPTFAVWETENDKFKLIRIDNLN